MKYLDKKGLDTLLVQLLRFFGYNENPSWTTAKQFWKSEEYKTTAEVLNDSMENRRKYLLEIDYEKELAFKTDWIIGDNAPYVGSAVVGQTYVA